MNSHLLIRLYQLFLQFIFQLFPIWLLRKKGASIGDRVFIGLDTYVEFENAHLLTVEDSVVIAAHSKFILHDSSLHNIRGFDVVYGNIVLKKGCYIGANTTVLPGSIVGEHTIVGANSLVKGVLEADSVYVGQPAKYVCSIDELQQKWQQKKRQKMKDGLVYLFEQKPYWDEN